MTLPKDNAPPAYCVHRKQRVCWRSAAFCGGAMAGAAAYDGPSRIEPATGTEPSRVARGPAAASGTRLARWPILAHRTRAVKSISVH